MNKYYESLAEWICDLNGEPEDDIIEIEIVYAFARYHRCSPEGIDRFIDSFVRTGHIKRIGKDRILRQTSEHWEYKESFNIVNFVGNAVETKLKKFSEYVEKVKSSNCTEDIKE